MKSAILVTYTLRCKYLYSTAAAEYPRVKLGVGSRLYRKFKVTITICSNGYYRAEFGYDLIGKRIVCSHTEHNGSGAQKQLGKPSLAAQR